MTGSAWMAITKHRNSSSLRPFPPGACALAGLTLRSRSNCHTTVPRPEDFRLWETCMTINQTWAYNKNDHDYKSAQTLIRSLVEVASRGGNLLLNVGPQPDGQIQPEFQERLKAVGAWLTVNGESIYGTTYGPVQNVPGLRTTAGPKSIYVHVFDWTPSGCTLAGIDSPRAVGTPSGQRDAAQIPAGRGKGWKSIFRLPPPIPT